MTNQNILQEKLQKQIINIPHIHLILPQDEAYKIIKESKNIINVKFIKKDGTLRSITGIRKAPNFLNGGDDTTKHIEEYINFFDINLKEYRKINTKKVKEITQNHNKYIFE
jgi:hypothetical protein